MGHINRIDISQLHSAKDLASALQRAGELRVSKGRNTAGTEVVFLRERTFVECIKDFFGVDAASRQSHADAALKLIAGFLDKHAPPGADSTQRHQTILNIRTEAGRLKSFTGSVVAEEMKNFLDSKNNVDPLKGGPVAASRLARTGINLRAVSPMRVVADNAVLRSTTVVRSLQENPELGAVLDRVKSAILLTETNRNSGRVQGGLHEQVSFTETRLTTPSFVLIPDLEPSADSGGAPVIPADALKLMYANALKGKSGTLVMEPLPDQFTHDKIGTSAMYSKEGLKMMMGAISDAVAEATKNGKKLHVTIACEDKDLITRLAS